MTPRANPTPVGTVTARATNPTTRRGTPWQERSPAQLWTTAPTATAEDSQGHPPAHPRHAIPTREHQKGGAPTRSAPARRGHPPRPPPARNPTGPPCRPPPHHLRLADRVKGAYGVAPRALHAPLDPAVHPQNRQPSQQGGHCLTTPIHSTQQAQPHRTRQRPTPLDVAVPHQLCSGARRLARSYVILKW